MHQCRTVCRVKGYVILSATGEAAEQRCGRLRCTQPALMSSSPPTSMRCARRALRDHSCRMMFACCAFASLSQLPLPL